MEDGRSGEEEGTAVDFVYWPDIEGLHHVLRNLKRGSSATTAGKVGYKGKIKLHGCNGAVTVSANSVVRVQSRNQFIDGDNKGLAKWAKENGHYFNGLWSRVQSHLRREFPGVTSCTVFGEWCGPGVQKGSEVAIGMLEKCIFAVFSLYIGDYLVIEPDDLRTILGTYDLPEGMHIIPWGFEYMKLHLDDERQLEGQLPKINTIVDEVDEFDPWVFQQFNIRGPGEGVVWYPIDLADKKLGSFKNALSVEHFSAYAFKTKGKRHQMVKKKDASKVPSVEAVTLHVEVVDSEDELADMFLTPARYEQALQEASNLNGDGRQHSTVEAIARWMVKDVRKEAQAEFEAASRPLNWEVVDRTVTRKVEVWSKESANVPRIKAVMNEIKSNQAAKRQLNSTTATTAFKYFDSGSSSLLTSPTSSSDIFQGLVFCFSDHFGFKQKSELTDIIKKNGGTVSYILNDKCTHLLATEREVQENISTKIRQARRFAEDGRSNKGGNSETFHIIESEWIPACVQQGAKVKEYPTYDILAKLRMEDSRSKEAVAREDQENEENNSVVRERKKIPQASVWNYGSDVEPYFPKTNFDILRMDLLHCMDIRDNHNKFYSMELHASNEYVSPDNPGRCMYRILTHHGRTDDLDSAKTKIGQKETRYLQSLSDAETLYEHIMSQKLADDKGYKHIDLVSVSPKIGSSKNAERDAEATAALAKKDSDASSSLPQDIQNLVKYLYEQASESVSKTVVAKITTRGIETPLGILSRKQIQRGEDLLSQLNTMLTADSTDETRIVQLSQDFYSLIPHRLGTSKEEVQKAIINNLQLLEQKQDLLQLMKDIIDTNNMRSRASAMSEVDRMYNALQCSIKSIDKASTKFTELREYFLRRKTSPPAVAALHASKDLNVVNIFEIDKTTGSRASLRGSFASYDNERTQSTSRLLFHASKVFNFVGLLSRGILLPKVVVSKGLSARTDFGYLGQGIYFSDNAYASVKYTNLPATVTSAAPSRDGKKRGKEAMATTMSPSAGKEPRFMLLADVELGQMCDYREITPHLTSPPAGFDSCHGVAGTDDEPSAFLDDEYVIYDTAKQRLRYLVEFTLE